MTAKELAYKVLQMLEDAGYEAYIVGGAPRTEKHNQHHSNKLKIKDYDIVTSATYEQVYMVFDGTYFMETRGAQFKVAVIKHEGNEIEVASYRGETYPEEGATRPDNVFYVKTALEDAKRRDFKINQFYQDLRGNVLDFHNGEEDIKNQVVSCVGDPNARFAEDPLRMLRAVRIATQMLYTIEPTTFQAIKPNLHRLEQVPHTRVAEEVNKILISEHPEYGIELLFKSGLAEATFTNTLQKKSVEMFPYMDWSIDLMMKQGNDLVDRWYLLLTTGHEPHDHIQARETLTNLMPMSTDELEVVVNMVKYQDALDLEGKELYTRLLDLANEVGTRKVFADVLVRLSTLCNNHEHIDKFVLAATSRPYFHTELPFNGGNMMAWADQPAGKWMGEYQKCMLKRITQMDTYNAGEIKVLAERELNERKVKGTL